MEKCSARAGTGGPGQDVGGSAVAESTQPQRGQVFSPQMPGHSPPSAGPERNPPVHPPDVTVTRPVSLVPFPPSPWVSSLADTGLLPGFMPGRSCRHHPSERGIAAEALSLAGGLVSITRLTSQSDITNFLSKPLPTGSARSSSNIWAHPGWRSLRLCFMPSPTQQCHGAQGRPSETVALCVPWYGGRCSAELNAHCPDLFSEAPHRVDK